MTSKHEQFMDLALGEARQALAEGEFPVGCVMVADDRVVARGRRRNTLEDCRNEIDHAEVLTLRSLIASQPELDLATVTVYSTLSPA